MWPGDLDQIKKEYLKAKQLVKVKKESKSSLEKQETGFEIPNYDDKFNAIQDQLNNIYELLEEIKQRPCNCSSTGIQSSIFKKQRVNK